ncbi:glycosyl hydrolase family 18 protein [Gemmatimonas phototrophica]|uniref:GH18 domain-containing protein n=1 Tax=Gemmatimonas phototrophica TaxID=1379270 RepID=A0A143BHF2_9BACT|nr:glycosyl hydrolase family 18 protein [Gemmatimonas phototrophica]AMW04476.1 hypothetical protein GEMMAAP_05725 [Gemmatimonas phototrophica]
MRNFLLLCALCVTGPELAAQRSLEAIWYIRNDSAGIASFATHAASVSIVAPQVYAFDSTGTLRGGTDARIVAIAKAHNVKLMPLVMNPGFDAAVLHTLVSNPAARARAASEMARICREERVHGIQLDLENLHVSDRDAFTNFARVGADSVHAAGCSLSAAVVPSTGSGRGVLPYHHWMHDMWRAAYDYKALAGVLDFLSYMTYAQHTGGSTPGPVAGYPWMLASVQHLLSLGVAPEKISLGLASYSDYWYPHYDPRTGDARARGDDIGYAAVMRIVRDAGATPRWDDTQKAWVAMWERAGVFEHAWIEDARAFREKLQLVRRFGFRGYSVWLMGLEDPETFRIVGPVRKD